MRDSLRAEGYILPCVCTPGEALDIGDPDSGRFFAEATIVAVDSLASRIRCIVFAPKVPFSYQAGQFTNLCNAEGAVRSYSPTSVPGLDENLAIHIKRPCGDRRPGPQRRFHL